MTKYSQIKNYGKLNELSQKGIIHLMKHNKLDVNYQFEDNDDITIWHYLARKNDNETLLELLMHCKEKGLKIDLNKSDRYGLTPIMHAAEVGNILGIKFLVMFGGNPILASYHGKTALNILTDGYFDRKFSHFVEGHKKIVPAMEKIIRDYKAGKHNLDAYCRKTTHTETLKNLCSTFFKDNKPHKINPAIHQATVNDVDPYITPYLIQHHLRLI